MQISQVNSTDTFNVVDSDFDVSDLDLNTNDSEWKSVFNKLQALNSLEDDWDGCEAISPNYDVITSAYLWLLNFMENNKKFPPSRILATIDGTIAVIWEDIHSREQIEFITSNEAELSLIGDNITPELTPINLGNLNQANSLTMSNSYLREVNSIVPFNKSNNITTWSSFALFQPT